MLHVVYGVCRWRAKRMAFRTAAIAIKLESSASAKPLTMARPPAQERRRKSRLRLPQTVRVRPFDSRPIDF
jgi:hypothetical protein